MKKIHTKIHYESLKLRCIKDEILHNGEKFVVYIIKGSDARSYRGKIFLNQSFFEANDKKERIAILYHEEYHMKRIVPIMKLLNIIRFRSLKKANHEEEFNADKYASEIVGKNDVISFLKKAEKSYEKDTIYDDKTHPTIDERIKRLTEL